MVMWHTVKFTDIKNMTEKTKDEKPPSLADLDQENHNSEEKNPAAEPDSDEKQPEPFKFEEVVPRAPPDNPPPARPRLGSQLKDMNLTFCQQTTAHGWGRVGRAPNGYVLSLWVAITIIALAINIMHVFILIKHYTRSEVKSQNYQIKKT